MKNLTVGLYSDVLLFSTPLIKFQDPTCFYLLVNILNNFMYILVQCEDPRCNVWQHIACVLIPEKPMDGVLPSPPETFYCEICRLSRADP